MANKIKVKLILELSNAGMSRNLITDTRHMSRTSVSDVINLAKEKSIVHENIKDKDEEEVYRMFYPDKHVEETMYKDPDYPYAHSELKKVGVNLKLLSIIAFIVISFSAYLPAFTMVLFALTSVLFDIPVVSSTCLYDIISSNSKACFICFLLYTLGLPSLKSGLSLAIAFPS